jgi:quercetin dioxygenase-like cupin family protein
MQTLDPRAAARAAVSARAGRPATAILQDTPDVRLVVFRLAPGEEVAPHRSPSTVLLTVLDGSGALTAEEGAQAVETTCRAGDVAAYAPNELHGMRAGDEELLLLATIAPRPGGER